MINTWEKTYIGVILILLFVGVFCGCSDDDSDCELDVPSGMWLDSSYYDQLGETRFYTNGNDWYFATKDEEGCWK